MHSYTNPYTKEQKFAIANKIKSITKIDAINDFLALKENPRVLTGLKFIDYFTFHERLNTKGCKGICFYDFFYNRDDVMKKDWAQKFVLYESARMNSDNEEKIIYNLCRLYFGSCNAFKPSIALEIYQKYKPTRVIDPFAGWGGRMAAAAALNIDYIGIDTNPHLCGSYNRMIRELSPHTKSHLQFLHQDSTNFPFIYYTYDMVFTSPPYYNTEIYTGTDEKTPDEWNELYKTVFFKAWFYLQKNGYFILNIPDKVYTTVCIPIFGECIEKIPLKIAKRNNNYQEYIYVWKR